MLGLLSWFCGLWRARCLYPCTGPAQAMQEMEEWTQNKSLINTDKGLSRAIPSGFPYFHVAWTGGGYAHIIEDEERFNRSFGERVSSCAPLYFVFALLTHSCMRQ